MLEHVIDVILPPVVAAEEAFGDDPAARLFPAEAAAVAQAVDTRRQEFTTGRACARAALARPGLRRAPRGPAGPAGRADPARRAGCPPVAVRGGGQHHPLRGLPGLRGGPP